MDREIIIIINFFQRRIICNRQTKDMTDSKEKLLVFNNMPICAAEFK